MDTATSKTWTMRIMCREPTNGNEYGCYNEWDKVQEAIKQLQQLHLKEPASENTLTGLAALPTIETECTEETV